MISKKSTPLPDGAKSILAWVGYARTIKEGKGMTVGGILLADRGGIILHTIYVDGELLCLRLEIRTADCS